MSNGMFNPKRTADTYGLMSDFVNRPDFCSSRLISLDARNRDPSAGVPADFSLQLGKLQQIRSIELRDGFISLPAGYTDPYVLLFLSADGLQLGNILSAGPVVQRHPDPTMIVPNHDAASGAFAQLLTTSTGIFVALNQSRRIVLRFLTAPMPKVSEIRVRLTDLDGNLLALDDERTDPTGTARVWLQLEVTTASG